jgi:hypothetical protein
VFSTQVPGLVVVVGGGGGGGGGNWIGTHLDSFNWNWKYNQVRCGGVFYFNFFFSPWL